MGSTRTSFVVALAVTACGSSSSSPTQTPDAGSDTGTPSDAAVADSGSDSPADAGGDAPEDAPPATRANGAVAPWQTLAPMPLPRANHCMAVANGYLVVIGGNYATEGGFESTDEVDVAKLASDGSLGPWQRAGVTPSPVNSCTSTAFGSSVLIVDGIFDPPADGGADNGGQVWSADLSSQGSLGAWRSLGALPGTERILYSQAWVIGTTLYAMDASVDRNLVATLHTSLGATLAPWVEDDWISGFRGHPQYAMVGNMVYTLGGYSAPDDAGNNDMLADVHGAILGADGHVGGAFTALSIPQPTGFGVAVGVDSYVFLVGGKSQIFGSGVPDVYSSHAASDGHLGAWSPQPGLPQGRTDFAAAAAGDYLYVTGGGFDAGGLNTVYSARVRF